LAVSGWRGGSPAMVPAVTHPAPACGSPSDSAVRRRRWWWIRGRVGPPRCAPLRRFPPVHDVNALMRHFVALELKQVDGIHPWCAVVADEVFDHHQIVAVSPSWLTVQHSQGHAWRERAKDSAYDKGPLVPQAGRSFGRYRLAGSSGVSGRVRRWVVTAAQADTRQDGPWRLTLGAGCASVRRRPSDRGW
jgi:hypothetical protein